MASFDSTFAQFNGVDDKIILPSGLSSNMNGLTKASMFIRLKVDNPLPAVGKDGLGHFATAGNDRWPTSEGSPSVHLQPFRNSPLFSYLPFNFPFASDFDQWHYMVVTTSDTGSYAIYIGNAASGPEELVFGGEPGQSNIFVPTNMNFGSTLDGLHWFDGAMSKAVFYNRELSSGEVSGLINSDTVPASGQLANYNFDTGGTGTSVVDSVGGYNGTLSSPNPALVWGANPGGDPEPEVLPCSNGIWIKGIRQNLQQGVRKRLIC